MHFEKKAIAANRRPVAKVRNAVDPADFTVLPEPGAHRVDASRRPDIVGNIDIRGGETERPATLVAMLDDSLNFEWPPQHRRRVPGLAAFQLFADMARGVDLRVRGRYRRDGRHRVTAAFGVCLKQRGIAAALMTEPKILANHHMLGPEPVYNDTLNELLAFQMRQSFVEIQDNQRVHAQRFDMVRLIVKGRQPVRRVMRPEETSRVRLESQDDQRRAVVARNVGATPDNGLMPAMHPVEIAQHHDALARAFRNVFNGSDDLHILFVLCPPRGPNLSRPWRTV